MTATAPRQPDLPHVRAPELAAALADLRAKSPELALAIERAIVAAERRARRCRRSRA